MECGRWARAAARRTGDGNVKARVHARAHLRPEPQIRKLQCAVNNGTFAALARSRAGARRRPAALAGAANPRGNPRAHTGARRTRRSFGCRACSAAGAVESTRDGEGADGQQPGMPQPPGWQQQQGHGAALAHGTSALCTCPKATQTKARTSQTRRFMRRGLYLRERSAANPIPSGRSECAGAESVARRQFGPIPESCSSYSLLQRRLGSSWPPRPASARSASARGPFLPPSSLKARWPGEGRRG